MGGAILLKKFYNLIFYIFLKLTRSMTCRDQKVVGVACEVEDKASVFV